MRAQAAYTLNRFIFVYQELRFYLFLLVPFRVTFCFGTLRPC